MPIRFQIAAVLYPIVQTVVGGTGLLGVLATPLGARAVDLLPPVVTAAVLLSAPIAWLVAPRLDPPRRSGLRLVWSRPED